MKNNFKLNSLFSIIAFIIIIITSNISVAYDNFSGNDWKSYFKINKKTKVMSKVKLSNTSKKLIRSVYNDINLTFLKYYGIDKSECKNSLLDIKIINEKDLDDKYYFPNEDDYSSNNLYILGRYFRLSKVLYIVPPFTKVYYWRNNFAHEMLHHLFNDCMIKFNNNDEEHRNIKIFLEKHKDIFY